MTKKEAMMLQKRCDKIMSGYLGEPCEVSMALSGKLKITFGHWSCYINLTKARDAVDYISYTGFYENLLDKINKAIECCADNRDIFDKLMWSYEHRYVLEED